MTRSSASLRLLLLPALVVVGAAIAWTLAGYDGDAKPQDDAKQWLAVQPQPIEVQLGLVGRIQAVEQAVLTAAFDAVIHEVLVKEGQSVEAGQTLLRLDPGLIDIQLRQAQAHWLKAQRDVHHLRQWESSTEVARARRAVQVAEAALRATEASLRDTRRLFERGIVARMEVDALTQQVQAQQLDLLGNRDELRSIQARGQGEDRKIAEMEWLNAQERYLSIQQQREQKELRAPLTGIVVRPPALEGGKALVPQVGLRVAQGTPLWTVIGLETIQVLTRVDEVDLHQLHEDMPVQITGDGFAGQVLKGRISTIAAQGNTTEAPGASAHYDVVISVEAPLGDLQQRIRLGMSAKLAISLYRNAQAIVVPVQALGTDEAGARYVLYRASPDAPVSKRVVTLGRAVPQGIEIQGVQRGYVRAAGP